ncbi:DUF3592 domain-containing protein [Streptomyces sp. NBC_00433]
MFDTVVTVWAVAWALAAALGAWRYARPRSSRTVRVAARVERVEAPRESGSDISSGVPAVIAFQNPSTGEALLLPTTGNRNGTLDAAWTGRPVTVRFPAGEPYRFRVVNGTGRQGELARPVAAACLAWGGLVVRLARTDAGWVPLGVGALVTALMTWAIAAGSRQARRRKALLSTAEEARARVVASLHSTHRDDDGHTHTRYIPVMTFTTADGRVVTAVSPRSAGRPTPHTIGADVPVHYSPADPSVFAFDIARDRRGYGCGLAVLSALAAAGAAAMVAGVTLLG